MKRFLPDVNTLLALLDPMHVHHEAVHRWYANQSPLRLIKLLVGEDEIPNYPQSSVTVK